jgi:cytochrome c oxidase assembly factor CtaG
MLSHEKRRKYMVTVLGARRERKAYTKWGEVWFHKGIVVWLGYVGLPVAWLGYINVPVV